MWELLLVLSGMHTIAREWRYRKAHAHWLSCTAGCLFCHRSGYSIPAVLSGANKLHKPRTCSHHLLSIDDSRSRPIGVYCCWMDHPFWGWKLDKEQFSVLHEWELSKLQTEKSSIESIGDGRTLLLVPIGARKL